MVDASDITNYKQSDWQLECSAIFWVLAAGKNGTRAADITNQLVSDVTPSGTNPFGALSCWPQEGITEMMRQYGTGCHNSKGRSIYELVNANLDLRTCSPQDLEKIYGIGKKTSRCFVLHSRDSARVAGLDTHILKFLDLMGVENVPKVTPSSNKEYLRLENEFLKLADKYKMKPSELDLAVWNEYKV
jgi:thermostable 8-oxoguanine DNA glycosylase